MSPFVDIVCLMPGIFYCFNDANIQSPFIANPGSAGSGTASKYQAWRLRDIMEREDGKGINTYLPKKGFVGKYTLMFLAVQSLLFRSRIMCIFCTFAILMVISVSFVGLIWPKYKKFNSGILA